MKKFYLGLLCIIIAFAGNSQVTLSGTGYSQNFDNVGSGLPAGFSVYTGATSSVLGTPQTFIATATNWTTATGQFRNSASYDGLISTSNTAAQAASTDRVIGLRQSAAFADANAAFAMQLANTTGFTGFTMIFKLQSLDVASPRVTTWLVDYGIGASPSAFTTVSTIPAVITTGGSSFASTNVTVDFGTALNNISQPVWIRIVTLTGTTGSGNRPTTGIDDLSLNYTNGIGCTPPSTQATAASIANISSNSFDINWTAGSGTNSLVVVKAVSAVSSSPANGTAYTANTLFGSGQTIAANEYVVYNGTGNTVNVTSLSPGTVYHAAVFTFDNGADCYDINSPALSNATTVCQQPTVQAGTIIGSPGINFAIINWTAGNGNASLVKINTVNSFTPPVDGTVYTGNTTYSGGEQTIYAGNAATVNVNGLLANTTYYVTVYSFNSCTLSPDYLATGNVVKTFTTNNAGTYYSSITGQTCAALKSALRDIITAGHVQLNYADLDNLYMPVTDDRLNDAGTQTIVWDIYTDNPNGPEAHELLFSQFNTGGSAEGQGWNKEHTFPQSWFGGGTNNFPGADLMHIFPADIFVNSGRGNLPYGKVASAAVTYSNGTKKGSSAINFPGYSGQVFEPIDQYKGDVARNYFYMVTRYENNQPAWESLATEGDVVMDGQTYPSIEIEYLRMLLDWNNSDPVSAKELARNNDVFSFQGNRNPYIDHPEYVGLVWSSSCGLALPVDLTEFNARLSGNTVLLTWKIERADGFNHFEIERNINGSFIKVGEVRWIAGQDNYSFTDDAAAYSGKVLYRLKMVDDNNVYKYSKVVTVNLPGINSIALVYPNPASNRITISFRRPVSSNAMVSIFDASGKNVSSSTLQRGQLNYQVNVQNLVGGMYLLKCVKDGEVSYSKFLIQQ